MRVPAIKRRQSGASMIEVMVAIVIVAFALLGMAGLMASSLRYQKTAHFRGIAAQQAAEIADRIRANMAGADGGSYAATGAYAAPACAPYALVTCPANDAACTATQDINRWRANLACGMAGGWGEIEGNFATNGYLRIYVYFREPSKTTQDNDNALDANCRAGALGAGHTDVRCFQTVVVP